MTYQDFLSQYPEFANTPAALVQTHLNAALVELDPVVWGIRFDQAHGYLTAHKLAVSPYGQNARMTGSAKEGGTSTYYKHFKDLMIKAVSPGALVP